MKISMILIIFLLIIITSGLVSANYFIDVNIPQEQTSIIPGSDIQANVKIIKISQNNLREDIDIKIRIIDENNNILIEKSKIIAIENEVNTLAEIHIPENVEIGIYKLEVEIGENRSSSGFIVESPKSNINKIIIYVLIFILTLSIIGFYFYNRKLNKLIKHIHKRVGIKDFIRRGRK